MSSSIEISVIVPLLNEERSIEELYDSLRTVLKGMQAEIVFVDDGSSDGSFDLLTKIAGSPTADVEVKAIRFRKNFGKSAAYAAGFEHASGKTIITIDADLQDDPKEIPRLMEKLNDGHDLVVGWKKRRQDTFVRRAMSRLFNATTSLVTGIKLHDFNCGFKAYRKEVTDELKVYGELHRYLPALAAARGFRIAEIEVSHHRRKYGRSRYGMERIYQGFLDLITILFITHFTRRPLYLFGSIGVGMSSLGGAIIVFLYLRKFIANILIAENQFLFLMGILLVIAGLQIFSIGLFGEMMSSITARTEKEYSISQIVESASDGSS